MSHFKTVAFCFSFLESSWVCNLNEITVFSSSSSSLFIWVIRQPLFGEAMVSRSPAWPLCPHSRATGPPRFGPCNSVLFLGCPGSLGNQLLCLEASTVHYECRWTAVSGKPSLKGRMHFCVSSFFQLWEIMFLILIYYPFLYLFSGTWPWERVEVRGNCSSQFSPVVMWVLGLNSGQQTWLQASLSTESIHWTKVDSYSIMDHFF